MATKICAECKYFADIVTGNRIPWTCDNMRKHGADCGPAGELWEPVVGVSS